MLLGQNKGAPCTFLVTVRPLFERRQILIVLIDLGEVGSMAQNLRARLGPLLSKLESTAKPVYKSTEKVVVEQYDKIIKGGEQYVVKDPAEADKLLKKWFYTNLSRLALKEAVLLSSF